ncbi:ABC transporter ATP-binding protein [Polynucleobacter asymbioticus]|uniref:ABC transporter related protein n=1 Tax=Polynucleobacter asymbioticus (strain DSM 18221 / CIP 109841 / QLW-P1DMWA-1) TaxID=312153 RepID=A4SVM6_POLAQ|nr:ABC transporter ATP-binding protein [Polynucleobacter asymbioticus]ABP33540.1 ABC transporter related protein [Polynucleobacter asymbioticus QLW-P1DMWA-1]
MSSNEIVIQVTDLSKRYEIYDRAGDRLKQFIFPKLAKLLGSSKNNYYRDFWALQDLSIAVQKGETVGIIGRNGSGKSTLLQIICGTLSPTHGVVKVNGRVAALLELGSGFNLEFTGRENVYLNAAVLGLTAEQIAKRFSAIEEFADIGEFIDQPVKTYSSGMMVRLAFSVIVHVDADILVIDEALAVGDAFFSQKCMRFLREFKKSGSIIFVSHDISAVKSFCDKVLWIEKGKMLQLASPKTVCESYLEAFYEAQQGSSTSTKLKSTTAKNIFSNPVKDQRLDFINTSNLRNDLEIFKFDSAASSFGTGEAKITDVILLDAGGHALSWIVGGEEVTLRITAQAINNISMPIVGFSIVDRLGQNLFGDNTFLTYRDHPLCLDAGEVVTAEFKFNIPLLPSGSYSINTAIASGVQSDHRQLDWVHDAIIFQSHSSSVCTGLMGIPMLDINMNIVKGR